MAKIIPAAHKWATNGDLIADVAQLYLASVDTALDATYGRGSWWTAWEPSHLTTNDKYTDAQFHDDFRTLGWNSESFDLVALDPPYKLNGTPVLKDFDNRYGVDHYMPWREKMQMIRDGITECGRVTKKWLLVKCQDQVCSGKVRWQTFDFANQAIASGFRLVDRFDMLGGGRTQPATRRQIHARNRPSTLLVFTK